MKNPVGRWRSNAIVAISAPIIVVIIGADEQDRDFQRRHVK